MTSVTATPPGETVEAHRVQVERHDATRRAPTAAQRVWAVTRMALGWVFLWAFLDKLFALGFATGRQEGGTIDYFADGGAWLNGGSPTYGFLEFGTRGPFADFFQSFAGDTWANWLFMIGLAGIGLALLFGVGMRIAAATGSVLLVAMWAAALWPTNNPFMDDHIIYALVLVGLALSNAGDTWGFGRAWGDTKLVRRYPVLK